MRIRPLSGALGAEIDGVRLDALDEVSFERLHTAFLEHLVIFVKDQQLKPRDLVKFAQRFGELDVRPYTVPVPLDQIVDCPQVLEVRKEPDDHGVNFGGSWHADVTFRKTPYLGSLLYALEVPASGGDTLWSNLYLAFETLSPGLQAKLCALSAKHSSWRDVNQQRMATHYGVKTSNIDVGAAQRLLQNAENGEAMHPVVRTHPDTGKKSLFVNRAYTKHFESMTVEESQPLLDWLYAHSVRPEFTCRFRWQPGTLALWDNRCTLHNPLNDYHGQRRVLHRVSIHGDAPI
jgi:taurine dioxygenase